MRIGYYFSHIGSKYGGIYQYALLVLKMLAASEKIQNITLFYSEDQKEIIKDYFHHPKVTPVKFDTKGKLNFLFKKESDFFLTRYYLTGRKFPVYPKLYKKLHPYIRFFNRYNLDLLHIPMQLSPVYHLRYPVLTTMHDLQQMYFPEFFSPESRMYKSISYYMALNESDHVLVSYNHVKKDILKFFQLEDDKVSVCLDPATEDWYYNTQSTSFEELKKKYVLTDEFMLTPAATWPHKNHISVLRALAGLKAKGKELFWVATGKKTPYYFDTLEPEIKKLGLEKQVLFPGLVSDADLVGLYKQAKLVVIPTLYEAGSGPLFEAMRFEVPVICSNATTLPEHIGNDEFVFEALKVDQITAMIDKAWSDKDFLKRNLENLKSRFAFYSKMNYVEAFENMYEKIIERNKNSHV